MFFLRAHDVPEILTLTSGIDRVADPVGIHHERGFHALISWTEGKRYGESSSPITGSHKMVVRIHSIQNASGGYLVLTRLYRAASAAEMMILQLQGFSKREGRPCEIELDPIH